MSRVNIELKGPLFDGRATAAVEDFLNEAKLEVGNEGTDLVDIWLGLHLKNPTGFYESQIVADRRADDIVINDNDVVYGPWLEGVSSRNQSTRFKGYRTFRVATQDLQESAPDIADKVLQKYLSDMQ